MVAVFTTFCSFANISIYVVFFKSRSTLGSIPTYRCVWYVLQYVLLCMVSNSSNERREASTSRTERRTASPKTKAHNKPISTLSVTVCKYRPYSLLGSITLQSNTRRAKKKNICSCCLFVTKIYVSQKTYRRLFVVSWLTDCESDGFLSFLWPLGNNDDCQD